MTDYKQYYKTCDDGIVMYLNHDIVISFRVSAALREVMDFADECFEKVDWSMYDIYRSGIEAASKQEELDGIITADQRLQIWDRYGL